MDWLIGIDERVFLAVNGLGRPWLDSFLAAVTWLGQGLVLALVVLGPMLLFDRRRFRAHALAMVLSVSIGALAVEGVKWAVDRDRPARHFAAGTGEQPADVRMPAERLHERSFPSGHAQAAFGAATYVSLLYPRWSLPAALLAALVGLSRVYLGVHFPLDVLGGALFGIAFSTAGFALQRRWTRRGTRTASPPE